MKQPVIVFIVMIILAACKSQPVPEKVKADKEKYIQVAQENSQPIDIDNLSEIYDRAKSGNVEAKMKHLEVDNIQTVYSAADNSEIKLDSIVICSKSDYLIFYDFAETARNIEFIKQKTNLADFEVVSDRLFMGKK